MSSQTTVQGCSQAGGESLTFLEQRWSGLRSLLGSCVEGRTGRDLGSELLWDKNGKGRAQT